MQKDKKLAESLREQQNRVRVISVLVLVLSILGIGWALFKPKTVRQPEVISLGDNWSTLENSAYAWQKDAYLTSVQFFMLQTIQPVSLQAVAEFHSLQVPYNESVQVAIYSDGTVVNSPQAPASSVQASDPNIEELLNNMRGSADDAIRRDDWAIDSQEALRIFAADEEISQCLESSRSMITLSLNKMLTDFPAWELSILECPNNSELFESYYLDAKTGERFDPSNP
jgi:hypothetical protein